MNNSFSFTSTNKVIVLILISIILIISISVLITYNTLFGLIPSIITIKILSSFLLHKISITRDYINLKYTFYTLSIKRKDITEWGIRAVSYSTINLYDYYIEFKLLGRTLSYPIRFNETTRGNIKKDINIFETILKSKGKIYTSRSYSWDIDWSQIKFFFL